MSDPWDVWAGLRYIRSGVGFARAAILDPVNAGVHRSNLSLMIHVAKLNLRSDLDVVGHSEMMAP